MSLPISASVIWERSKNISRRGSVRIT
jgi:hypothetical protein